MTRAMDLLFWVGPAIMLCGGVVLVSPWTLPVYLSLFPSERTNVAYQIGAGGPYPELLGLPIILLGSICFFFGLR